MSVARYKLPDRRFQVTFDMEWKSRVWAVSVGFAPDGRVMEVFVKGHKTGSEMDSIMDDVCVLFSLMLQTGYSAEKMHAHLGREGVDALDPAASPIGLMAAECAKLEAGFRQGVGAFHAGLEGGA